MESFDFDLFCSKPRAVFRSVQTVRPNTAPQIAMLVVSGTDNEEQEVMQAENVDEENADDFTGVTREDNNAQDNDNEQSHQPRSSCQSLR